MRLLVLGLLLATLTGCSSAPPPAASASATPAASPTAAAPDTSAQAPIPPQTRDPFEHRVGQSQMPPTRPMKRVGVDYPRPQRDPFTTVNGKSRSATPASQAADPDAGSRIARPKRPDLKVLAVQRQGDAYVADLLAQGSTVRVQEGDFVLGCRVTGVDARGVDVTRSGVPFRLALK